MRVAAAALIHDQGIRCGCCGQTPYQRDTMPYQRKGASNAVYMYKPRWLGAGLGHGASSVLCTTRCAWAWFGYVAQLKDQTNALFEKWILMSDINDMSRDSAHVPTQHAQLSESPSASPSPSTQTHRPSTNARGRGTPYTPMHLHGNALPAGMRTRARPGTSTAVGTSPPRRGAPPAGRTSPPGC